MTKIKIVSDVHVEFDRDHGRQFLRELPNENTDILVVAGDLGVRGLITDSLRILCDRFPEVIFVMGNHSSYHSSIEYKIKEMEDLDNEIGNLHFLENRKVEILGETFVGCTLWFKDDPNRPLDGWSDFRFIDGAPSSIFEQNKKNVKFLEENVDENSCIITHHLPSYRCVDPEWQGSPFNCYFVCDMEKLIYDKKPKLWIHAHSHSFQDITIDETRVIRNPRAYPHENSSFNPDLLIDTET